MTDERLCTLTELNDKARNLARAAAELMQADKLFSTSDLHTNDRQKQFELWDLLRLHDTCGSLLFSLIDIFDRVDGQLNAEDAERIAAGATTEKPMPTGSEAAPTDQRGGTAKFNRLATACTAQNLEREAADDQTSADRREIEQRSAAMWDALCDEARAKIDESDRKQAERAERGRSL